MFLVKNYHRPVGSLLRSICVDNAFFDLICSYSVLLPQTAYFAMQETAENFYVIYLALLYIQTVYYRMCGLLPKPVLPLYEMETREEKIYRRILPLEMRRNKGLMRSTILVCMEVLLHF